MDNKLYSAMMKTRCLKHNADLGDPCWDVYPDTKKFGILSALCGPRVRAAGFVGAVNLNSKTVKSVRRNKK